MIQDLIEEEMFKLAIIYDGHLDRKFSFGQIVKLARLDWWTGTFHEDN